MSSKHNKLQKVRGKEENLVKKAWDLPKQGHQKPGSTRDDKSKFDIACQQIEESVKRYFATHELKVEDEDQQEEHNFHESEIIERILGGYENERDLDRTHHHLQEAFRSGALICLVCIENIKRNDYVWSCEECCCTFHLDCIQKWAKDSIYLQSQAESEEVSVVNFRQQREKRKILQWFCPKCRYDYPNTKIPSEYKCFCGKQRNPQFDPWLIPHSCGEKCKKKLRPDCGHSCLLLCHPGPCPPCPVMVRYPCYCPKAVTRMRRCFSKAWSCDSICGRFLVCNQHKCQDRCHAGPCETCHRTSNQKCQCGSSSQIRPCADLVWQCEKVCGNEFSCGHHNCERVCHKGLCGECPFGGKRTCPCGKMTFTLPCTEFVPTCGDTCSKPLSCGIHFCAERCHKCLCPSCLQVRVKKCNCGAREKELPCTKNFTCEVKCKRMRDCRKHACNRKCCTGVCPSCDHPCGKTLGCGQHKCESRCHQMRCYPCSITHKISCSCGATSITVPCGREKKTPIPKCNVLCKKKSVCHHPKPEPHRCHEGRCPSCTLECGLKLQCSHTCPKTCHDAVPVKIVHQQKRAGPWEKISSPQIEIRKLPCPPCMVKIPNICHGKHETTDWPCSELRPYSCGRECGRELACLQHKCAKECHIVEGSKDEHTQGVNCESCDQPCSKPRLEGCSHPCKLRCHAEPCPKCQEVVFMQCHCSILQITVVCHQWVTSNPHTKEKMRSCTNQCNKEISCGHRCQKQCHSGKCSSPEDCRKKVAVRCPCKRLRKDFLCHSIVSGKAQLLCDEVCTAKVEEKKKAMEAVKLKRKLVEEEARQKELEEYERFMQGRKKKRKRKTSQFEGNENDQWWKSKSVLAFVGVLIISIIMYYIFTY